MSGSPDRTTWAGALKPLREARREFERAYIIEALRQAGWSVGTAARVLGLPRPNLYRKARQLAISLKPPDREAAG